MSCRNEILKTVPEKTQIKEFEVLCGYAGLTWARQMEQTFAGKLPTERPALATTNGSKVIQELAEDTSEIKPSRIDSSCCMLLGQKQQAAKRPMAPVVAPPLWVSSKTSQTVI